MNYKIEYLRDVIFQTISDNFDVMNLIDQLIEYLYEEMNNDYISITKEDIDKFEKMMKHLVDKWDYPDEDMNNKALVLCEKIAKNVHKAVSKEIMEALEEILDYTKIGEDTDSI